MKNYMGVPEFLPDTELERLNTTKSEAKIVEIPEIYTQKTLR